MRFLPFVVVGAILAVVVGVAQASVLFNGDFDSSGLYEVQTVGSGSSVTLDSSFACDGRSAKHFTIQGSGTGTVRSQQNTARILGWNPPVERYTGWSTYFPSNFVAGNTASAFFVFMQFFAKTENGSPPMGFYVKPGTSTIEFVHNIGGTSHSVLASFSMTKGAWMDFVVRANFSKTASVGWAELMVNGQQIPLKDPDSGVVGTRASFSTVNSGATEPARLLPTNYKRAGMPATTLWHDEIKIGTTLADVETSCRPGAEPTPTPTPTETPTPTPTPPPDEPAMANWTPPSNAIVGQPVTFDGTSSTGDAPLTCLWEFTNTDGSTVFSNVTGCTTQKTFTAAGEKYARLKVTDADGDTNTSAVKAFTVSEPPPPPDTDPTDAAFSFSDQSVAPGEAVTATVDSVDGGEAPYTYQWHDVGCSTPCAIGTGSPMTRSFANIGTKHYRLTVTDADGDVLVLPHDHAQHDVVVSSEPEPTPTPTPTPTPDPVPTGSLPRLETAGNDIVRADRETPVMLRGVNVMNAEWNGTTANEKLGLPKLASDWKGNVVVRGFASDPVNARNATYLAQLDDEVALGRTHRFYVVFAFRSYAVNSGQPSGVIDSRATQALTYLAQRYRDEPHVLFALQAEPSGVTWDQVEPLWNQMVASIRGPDGSNSPDQPLIFAPGIRWSHDVSGSIANPVDHPNVAYKVHPYGPQSFWQGDFLNAHDAGRPVFIGEFSLAPNLDSTMTEVNALLTTAREREIGWAAWIFDTCNCGDGQEDLISSWSTAAPNSPFGTTVQAEMQQTPPIPD